ncbi:sensor histidine kinase [Nocardioides bruguierae]|uniref:histidine kinase n=1 Tax=Nocardioides bruguierae TaxID=2945102 RepID=A0A9X2IGC7_9ACTN|nr:HAMP domain-containing sensor histidine kinase [Nocardioides bruguierae]MCM0622237.1 HAMP domain-containing histidine kinase [Nocardioides bruguierae]
MAASAVPHPVLDDLGSAQDLRVRAVLDVLAGHPRVAVAAAHAVEPALLDRWVTAFVEAGAAQVTNRPQGETAQQRDRFLTVFTHGLRSPLAVAQAWVGLLGDLSVDPGTRVRALERLQQSLDSLADRVSEVELLTAAMLGRLDLDAREVSVGRLASAVTRPEDVGGDGPWLRVFVDPVLFMRVLRDLWSAAATTQPLPRRVSLESRTVGSWVELRVVRSGDPVEPETARSLFEPFNTGHGEAGLTVGLYLARALTVVHGGTLGLEQDEERAAFWVRVPAPGSLPERTVEEPSPTAATPHHTSPPHPAHQGHHHEESP